MSKQYRNSRHIRSISMSKVYNRYNLTKALYNTPHTILNAFFRPAESEV